ncbi:hypothetical protein KI387_006879 [Taxus chinensis]|uniref:C2 domain-containing protein n=1 Tax=Taxus chinensis TaxID=29808 RepID=A0AA38GPT5_TAXCH|nr:hypothetical protein KI387_006879 [Taxus chinensis]
MKSISLLRVPWEHQHNTEIVKGAHALGWRLLLVIATVSRHAPQKKGRFKGCPKAEIELRIISADDLEDVKRFSKMKCYAEAYSDPNHKATTPVDEDGGNETCVEPQNASPGRRFLSSPQTSWRPLKWTSTPGAICETSWSATPRIRISQILKGTTLTPKPKNPINCRSRSVWETRGYILRAFSTSGLILPPVNFSCAASWLLSMKEKNGTVCAYKMDAEDTSSPTALPALENTSALPAKSSTSFSHLGFVFFPVQGSPPYTGEHSYSSPANAEYIHIKLVCSINCMNHRRKEDSKGAQKREIELRIISADDLEDVKRFSKMKCYAEAYIDPNHKATTPVDEDGGTNPVWNHKMLLQADDSLLSDVLAAIKVDIYARGHLRDKLVGNSRILISQILKGDDSNPNPNPINCVAVQVWRPAGHPQGILNVWIPPAGKFLLRRLSMSMKEKNEPDALQNDAEDTSSPTALPALENTSALPAQESTSSLSVLPVQGSPPSQENTPPSPAKAE